jgi:thioester reductase-like protein
MNRACFVTGATGLVGRELARTLLTQRQCRLLLLVRAPDEKVAQERSLALFDGLGLSAAVVRDRVRALRGDIGEPRLGLSQADYHLAQTTVQTIFHSAAIIKFNPAKEEADRINVRGTQQVLELAERAHANGQDVSFHHISSFAVAGRRTGVFRESDQPIVATLMNNYERSKAQAEALVQAKAASFPATIYRLSQVVGHSQTGYVNSPSLFYRLVQDAITGQRLFLPRAPGVPFDLTPVDYVASAIEYLSRQPGVGGKTFHVVAGKDAVCLQELVEVISRVVDHHRAQRHLPHGPKPVFVPPILLRAFLAIAQLNSRGRRMARALGPVVDYLTLKRTLDDRGARQLLDRAGIHAPHIRQYADALVVPFLHLLDSAPPSSPSKGLALSPITGQANGRVE